MRVTLGEHGMNWMWYLDVTLNDDLTATIHNHWRMHKYRDDNHPKYDYGFSLMEDSKREVYGLKTNGKEYVVTNPKHIFSYGKD